MKAIIFAIPLIMSFSALAQASEWRSMDGAIEDKAIFMGCLSEAQASSKTALSMLEAECKSAAKESDELKTVFAYSLRIHGSPSCNGGRDFAATCHLKFN